MNIEILSKNSSFAKGFHLVYHGVTLSFREGVLLMSQPFTVVLIANSGVKDAPLPDYLLEALKRFQVEVSSEPSPGSPVCRHVVVAHDVMGGGGYVWSDALRLNGTGVSTLFSIADMVSKAQPAKDYLR